MATSTVIRFARREDYTELGQVMFDAVHNGCPAYTPAQLRAWLPTPPAGAVWNQRLDIQRVFVAEAGGRLLGFLSLTPEGLIDLAFIRPVAQGTGLFRRLYQALEQSARESRIKRLQVYASLVAQPAFSAMGFTVHRREQVSLGEQTLARFAMYKGLDDGA